MSYGLFFEGDKMKSTKQRYFLFAVLVFLLVTLLSGCNSEAGRINKYLTARGVDKIKGGNHEKVVDNTYNRLFHWYFYSISLSRKDQAERASDFIIETKSYDVLIHIIDLAFGNDNYHRKIFYTFYPGEAMGYAADTSLLSLIKISTHKEKTADEESVLDYFFNRLRANSKELDGDDSIINHVYEHVIYYLAAFVMEAEDPQLFQTYYPNVYEEYYENFPFAEELKSMPNELKKMISDGFAKGGLKQTFPASAKIPDKISFVPKKGAYIIIYDDSEHKTYGGDNLNYKPRATRYKTEILYPESNPKYASLIIYENYEYEPAGTYTGFQGESAVVYIRHTTVSVVEVKSGKTIFKNTYRSTAKDEYSYEGQKIIIDTNYEPDKVKLEIEKNLPPGYMLML